MELSQKKQKLNDSDNNTMTQKHLEDDQQWERDAIEIQKRHEEFIEKQTMTAEKYRKRKRQVSTVSSKTSVVDTESSWMEGKGPRTVPKSVKNYRKRLKKKHSRTKHSISNSTST